jgi:hypothetical protein
VIKIPCIVLTPYPGQQSKERKKAITSISRNESNDQNEVTQTKKWQRILLL